MSGVGGGDGHDALVYRGWVWSGGVGVVVGGGGRRGGGGKCEGVDKRDGGRAMVPKRLGGGEDLYLGGDRDGGVGGRTWKRD